MAAYTWDVVGRDRLRGCVGIASVLLNRGEWSDREALRRYQGRRLRALVEQAFRVPFYRRRFEEAGVRPGDLRSVDDLSKLPVCSRSDLNETPACDLVESGVDPAALRCHCVCIPSRL